MRCADWFPGAVNPRDNDLAITDEGDHLVFDGKKHFNTGGVVSDLTVLEGVLEGTDNHIFVFVPTKQPGIQFAVRFTSIASWVNYHFPFQLTPSVQLEQHRSSPDRIRQRHYLSSPRPLDRRPRMGSNNTHSQSFNPDHPLRIPPPPHHPISLLQFLHRHRAGCPSHRLFLHQDRHPRMALRRGQQNQRHGRILRPRALRQFLRAPACRRSACRSCWKGTGGGVRERGAGH